MTFDLVLRGGHVLRSGRIVWDPGGLSMPDWQDAPAAYSAYWTVPALQGH